MKTRKPTTTNLFLAMLASHLLAAPVAQAAISLISGVSIGAAVDPEVPKSGITVSGASTNGAVPQNLVNSLIGSTFPSHVWFDGGAPTSTTLGFDLGGTFNITSVTVDFAWQDRDEMDYSFIANTATQGSFGVDDSGATGNSFPGEPQTTFVFASGFTTSSIDLFLDNISRGSGGNEASPAIAEITFHGTEIIPEPSRLVLLGLGLWSLLMVRSRRHTSPEPPSSRR